MQPSRAGGGPVGAMTWHRGERRGHHHPFRGGFFCLTARALENRCRPGSAGSASAPVNRRSPNILDPNSAPRPMPRPTALHPTSDGAEPTRLDAALRRAFDAAGDGGADDCWRFLPLAPEAACAVAWLRARQVEEEDGLEAAMAALDQMRSVPGWVVVTCPRAPDAAEAARLRERTFTAVQRASLQLWMEGIRTTWSPDLVADDPAFYAAIGVDAEREVALGVLWHGHAERR